jgi:hypothetical protein
MPKQHLQAALRIRKKTLRYRPPLAMRMFAAPRIVRLSINKGP